MFLSLGVSLWTLFIFQNEMRKKLKFEIDQITSLLKQNTKAVKLRTLAFQRFHFFRRLEECQQNLRACFSFPRGGHFILAQRFKR